MDTESGSIRTVRSIRGYDGEFRTELQGEAGNGVRQWRVDGFTADQDHREANFGPIARYDNFMTIDWIHDAIKDSLRRRKLRHKKRTEGIRGWLANVWDGSQGWLLATCIGEFS
jgi:chloride channel 3/4/5